MTDQELEQRLRAWYVAEVGAGEAAPPDLRDSLATIPAPTPTTLRRGSRRRGLTLLAVAAVLIVGGALAAVSGLGRPTPVVTPDPNLAIVLPSSSPPSRTPSPTANLRPGAWIAFNKVVQLKPVCPRFTSGCVASRVWIVGSDGGDAHALLPDGTTNQTVVAWSPDGTRLLYTDEDKLYVTDANGSGPNPVDTGCVSPCFSDSQMAFSSDGRSIVFVRSSSDATSVIATMDLATGRVSELSSTASDGSATPGWSPDGKQIVFFRVGEKDGGGPVPPRLSAVWVVDADGQNLRQASPLALAAQNPGWSPDGTRILFESPDGAPVGGGQDIYTIRPDGSDVSRLTTDGVSTDATWTADGRILFVRGATGSGGSPGWWTMDADGTGAAVLVTNAAIGVKANLEETRPVWQPTGGSAIVPPPWTASTATAVGPPAPTPSPTPTPSLAPGFAWSGTAGAADGGPAEGTATLLADGRVLFAGTCSTAAGIYDSTTGVFTPTGSMTVARAASAATRLQDGHVLFTGGSGCNDADTGIRASAELYDPSTGTFSPTGSMHTPRESHTSTLLADGRVLITGGITGPAAAGSAGVTLAAFRLVETSANVLNTAEIYDPATGTFSTTGSMSSIRDQHTATLLQDGRVLVVGGGGEGYSSVSSADLYDPATGKFSKTGSMKVGRWLHTATLLQDGRVLVTGGRSPKDSVYTSAETYNPATGKFSSAGSMSDGRQQHTATLLQDGRVFIAGGYWSDGQKWAVQSSTEIYDPATGNFSPTGSMGAPRDGHSATLLDDGRVLIAGGEDIGSNGGIPVPSAVLYQP
jgi:Tol biopolymer transport system component